MTTEERVVQVLAAYDGANTRDEYNAAKRLHGRLDAVSQLAIVDSAIAAIKRVRTAERPRPIL